jgi:hypothetical protein
MSLFVVTLLTTKWFSSKVSLGRGTLPELVVDAYESQRRKVAEYHAIWYLSEILYLNCDQDDSVSAVLVEWVHVSLYPNTSPLRAFEQGNGDEQGVWRLCAQLLVQGCCAEAALCMSVLQSRVSSGAAVLGVLSQLVVELPRVNVGSSARDVLIRHGVWRSKCVRMLQVCVCVCVCVCCFFSFWFLASFPVTFGVFNCYCSGCSIGASRLSHSESLIHLRG